jgi:nucleotide-binding universal stress UspA family protein
LPAVVFRHDYSAHINMNTILVLIDFSEASSYAALYACILAKQLGCRELVLYHAYQDFVSTSETVIVIGNEESLRNEALGLLTDIGKGLRQQLPESTTIRYRADTMELTEINNIAAEEGAWLIVMGTTGKSKLEEMTIGSNAIRVCKASYLPVILVPSHIRMQPLQQIIFACDMKEIEETIPAALLKKMLDLFHVPLTVLNVDYHDRHFTSETPHETMKLHELLQQYDPAYHNMTNPDIAAGIVEFARNYQSPIILLIPKYHDFPGGLFHRSITRQLAYHSPIPLLVLHGKNKK